MQNNIHVLRVLLTFVTISYFTSFRSKTVYFTQQNVLLKQPIRIDYLMKQKPRGALAGKQERMRHQKRWAAKWRVTVSGELWFMTSYLEN